MKRLFHFFVLVLVFSQKTEAQQWWQKATGYEIFVRSFQDFNADGKGDFNGLQSRLNYLNDGDSSTYSDLGIQLVWLMPIQPSPSYHGYDVTQYKAVNPEYGSMDEFKEMLAAAHQKGIKVVLDLVLNHTSNQHPWFVKSAANDSFYRNFYRWENKPLNAIGPWGQTVWHSKNNQYYYGVFWSGMPDLNYNYKPVRDSIFDIAKFWIKEIGVDGFRLDAVTYLYEEGNILKHHPNTLAFWQSFKDSCKSWNPNTYLVAEVWDPQDIIKQYASKFDQCFEFGVAGGNINAINSANPFDSKTALKYATENYDFASFITNHDQDRIASLYGNNQDKLKAVASLLLTQPGTPWLYYGEEVAMLGTKPDENIRRPMQWQANNFAGFSTVMPWRPLNSNYPQFNVSTLSTDPNSIFHHYRKLIHFRNQHEAIYKGTYKSLIGTNNEVFIFQRSTNNQDIVVMVNTSALALPSVQFSFSKANNANGTFTLKDVISDSSFSISSTGAFFSVNLPMQPYQTRILRFEPSTSNNEISPEDFQILVFPNPAKEEISIELANNFQPKNILLISMKGEVLQKWETENNQIQLKLNQAPGIYNLQIISGQNTYHKLLMIH
jgi:glycosidase